MGFVGTGSAFCRAAPLLLVLAVHCIVLHGFCWYSQCIVSCCLGFVGTDSALCRAAWVLLVLTLLCVELPGFCWY